MKGYCPNCMRALREADVCPHCGFDNALTPPPHILRPGTLLNNRYLLGNSLGQGGFGITYIGLDRTLQMRVAVKEYFPNACANRNVGSSDCVTVTTPQARAVMEAGKAKFLQEARILARFCGTPGIVDVLDFFEGNDTAYIVMEYLEGQDLRRYLRNHAMSAEEAFSLMLPVMDSLEKIHAEHIIHRDISPDNIMRLKDGSLKLMDFGAARIVDYSNQKSVSVMLKAGYAPPEQYRSKGALGPWTDIYGLCATLYKCITGVMLDDALERSDSDRTRWPSEMGIPITLLQENVLKKGLALRRQERFQSIGELRRTLNGPQTVQNIVIDTEDATVYYKRKPENPQTTGTAHSVSESPVAVEQRTDRPSRKASVFALVAALILCLTIGAAALWNRYGGTTTSQENPYQETLAALLSQGETKGMDLTDAYHVTLQSNVDIPIDELSSAFQTIQDRLDILTDGQPYVMVTDKARMELLLPKDTFDEDESAQSTLDFFIGNRFNLTIADAYLGNKEKQRWEDMPVYQKDFRKVTLQYGSVDEIDPSERGIQSEQYWYMQIDFTSKFAEELSSKIAMWGDKFLIYIFSNSVVMGRPIALSEDGQRGYIVFNGGSLEEKKTHLKLWEYNFSHDSLNYYFDCIIDIDYRTEWEDVKSVSFTGVNQCNVDDFSEGTVSFTIGVQSDKLNDSLSILKRRMDALETPYAIGFLPDHTDNYMVVKTTLNHIGVPFLRLIDSDYVGMRIATDLSEREVSDFTCSLMPDSHNGYGIQIRLKNQYDVQRLQELSQILTNQGGGALYLTSGYSYSLGQPVYFSANIDHVITDGAVTFTSLFLTSDKTLKSDALWIFNFFDQIWNGVQPDGFRYFQKYQFYPGEDGRMPSEADFGVFNPEGQKVQRAIQEIDSSAEVSVSGANVEVKLHLAVDETLPEQTALRIKKICERCDFEHSPFKQIYFQLSWEDRQKREFSRIYFQKHFGSAGTEDGCLYLSGEFHGGRMNRYRERMKEIVETDPFFMEWTHPEYSEWDFGISP